MNLGMGGAGSLAILAARGRAEAARGGQLRPIDGSAGWQRPQNSAVYVEFSCCLGDGPLHLKLAGEGLGRSRIFVKF
jgi:hypothetical protein